MSYDIGISRILIVDDLQIEILYQTKLIAFTCKKSSDKIEALTLVSFLLLFYIFSSAPQ